MSQKIIQTVLAAALAPAGTLTLSYPAGTNPGSFVGGKRHRVVSGSGDTYKSPKDFTLSYGASSITLTWGSSSPTLPVNTKLFIQLDMAGSSPQRTVEKGAPALNNTVGEALKLVDFGAPLLADADGICASQSVTANVAALLNGALAGTIAAGRMILDVPRNVVAAWTSAAVLTGVFKDEYGNTFIEQSASGTSFTGKKAVKEIVSIKFSGNVTGATVGTGNVLGIPAFVSSVENIDSEFENGVNMKPVGRQALPYFINATDLSAGTNQELVAPFDGYIDTLRTMVQVAIVTGGDITVNVNTVAVTGLTVTVANSATVGTGQSDTPTTPRSSTTLVSKGDRISIVPAAAFNGGGAVNGVLEIEPRGLQGTLVVGDLANAPTATTGDVRGTYTPRTAPDGATRFALVVRLSDPDFIGQDQYNG